MLSRGRLVLVDTGGLLGEVIATELEVRDDVHIVDDIEDLAALPERLEAVTVCIVFGFVQDLSSIRCRLAAQLKNDPLVILIDHTDPYITLFRLTDTCVTRKRMGLRILIDTLQIILDDGITTRSDLQYGEL